MRVLIGGATGFIGSRLAELLAEAGHEVWGFSRNPDTANKKVASLTQVFPWNPIQQQPPTEAFEGVDAVVHLAGESVAGRWTGRKKTLIRDSRVIGTRNLVSALERAKNRPEVLVSASAIGYYGHRGEETLEAEAGPGDDFLAEVCQEWEREAQRASGLGIRVVNPRIGIVLARGGGALQAMLLPFKLGLGGPLGSGRQWWSWIHRDDLTAILRSAVEDSSMAGVYNATSPEPTRQKEFGKVLGSVLRRPAFMPAPAFALKLVLGGFSAELLASKRVVPSRLRDAGFSFRYPELRPALEQALGKK